jgi:hypothetical protein
VTKEVFGDHVNWERIFNVYVDRRSDSFTTRFREEVMEKQPFSGPDGGRKGDERRFGAQEKWKE